VCADSSRSIVEAMRSAGTRRLVVVSGTGPFDEGEGPGMRYVIKPIGRLFLKNVFADFVAMEDIVRTSGLDWTILRPSRLTDKAAHRSLPHAARPEPTAQLHGVSG
jgi:putative NADH-flavin reductase